MSKKFNVWLDSGANIHSAYKRVIELDMPDEEWDAMTEDDKDEYMREFAFERSDWGYREIEGPKL